MRRSDALPACTCAAAAAVAFFLTWPFAELPFNDDWSYAFTARHLAQTGHLTYNGWATAAIIPQAYWGALIIRVFGFSFTALRMGTLPFAMASAAVCYLLARRSGLSRKPAVFASLTLSLGPMFLPLATSFMTDVPGLMFMLLSLYALIRCGESTAPAGQLSWLATGALTALLGGMDRQIVWIVPLAVVPYLMIVHRRSVRFLAAAGAAWIIVLLGAVATVRWFNAQPYAIPDPPLSQSLKMILQEPQRLWQTFFALWLTTSMLALPAMLLAGPVALGNLLARWKGPRGLIALVLILLTASFLLRSPRFIEMPWLGTMLTPQGILGKFELLGRRPTVLPRWFRQGIGAVVWILTAIILADRVGSLPHTREAFDRLRRRFAEMPLALPCIAILAAAYTVILLSRTGRDLVFDRYALPLVPFLAIAMLLWWQNAPLQAGMRRLTWRVAAVALGLYAVYAVASTQEVLALARARVEAMRRLQAVGVPPTDVDDGVEQMAWTQLEVVGHINYPDIRNPPDAYHPGKGYTPCITPVFQVEASPDPRASSILLGEVEYFSLLPPFHRQNYIYGAPPPETSQ
ncbi:MAG: glycosyltransferase family 39 protein [Tepidisphaeraceae bacterium]